MSTAYKCHFCPKCDGGGCVGELPGMGGFGANINFQLNCAAWDFITVAQDISFDLPALRLAPITGAVENIGYENEERFYTDMIHACDNAGIKLSIGDGCPDIKLQSGIAAVKKLTAVKPSAAAAVFIKPYANNRILERFEWSRPIAEILGVDIDSYNILTMRHLVQLEKKTAEQLAELKRAAGVPFAVKGIFTRADIEIVKTLKPDIAVISNHGGRVDNGIGSTAEFLKAYGAQLKNNCGALWVDGGIRTSRDVYAAGFLGAAEVMIGRPLISALCAAGAEGVKAAVKLLRE